jgi:hypothetical protein
MRLRTHFAAKGMAAEWERDFVDVRWEDSGQTWIGEVKLTRYLSRAEAFRMALGQLLVYCATQFSQTPRMVMFLDQPPDNSLLSLAERLGIFGRRRERRWPIRVQRGTRESGSSGSVLTADALTPPSRGATL